MNIKEMLTNYVPFNEQEKNDKEVMLQWLSEGQDLFTRNNPFAHFSASAWIVDTTHTKVLMAYHNIYQSYSWLGGHNDGDTDFIHVATKEVQEESGLQHFHLLSDEIFSIEILTVNGHEKHGQYVPSHLHLNLTYLFEADMQDTLHIKEDENSAIAWFTKQQALEKCSEEWMKDRVYQKLNQKLEYWKKIGIIV